MFTKGFTRLTAFIKVGNIISALEIQNGRGSGLTSLRVRIQNGVRPAEKKTQLEM